VRAARLARLIREQGHLAARIDPLGAEPVGDPELEASTHGLHPEDLEALPASVVGGPLAEISRNALEAVGKLRHAYCGSVGYEDDHLQIPIERVWLREAAESRRFFTQIDEAQQRDLLERLTEVETFERFLHHTFAGQKRFSIEGTDMLVPMLDRIIHEAAATGTREVVMGMAHRGRLNVLAHVLGKPYSTILSEFQSTVDQNPSVSGTGTQGWTGDVKYHLGAHMAYVEGAFTAMPLTLAPNPSHLEYVDPVIMGRCRAAQEERTKPGAPYRDPKAAGAIMVHGDASFPGQGIVAETLNLSRLAGYSVGGTIHIITNNQIGFTTSPGEGRSTLYAGDLAKGFEIPIIHVNADDPIACIAVARMAFAYCTRFHKDFLIDLVGYRRWGHNEGDEPSFTQPRMSSLISAHPTVRELWATDLEQRGVVTHDEAETMVHDVQERLRESRWARPTAEQGEEHDVGVRPPGLARPQETAVPAERLRELNEALLSRPEGFTVNPKLERVLSRRKTALNEEHAIDWAHAETLALASILADGTPVRLSGQDSERGTFSQRHIVLHDATGKRYVPLQALPPSKASFAVHNSPLSESAVLGFEYGYSMHATEALVLWEAQFGDFANSAQVIIDQFIVSGYSKWRQTPSLVLLLPHGYEGQGPDHSSARLERFLQLAACDNIRVANCTTAAQYFHLLRRQAQLIDSAPRPLVVMTPKSLLRHPLAASSLVDLATGRFFPVLDDVDAQRRADRVTRVVLCSGKVYADLRTRQPAPEHVAVVRLEQLYPFPEEELREVLTGYRGYRELVWLQEEPRNMGAWGYVTMRLRRLLGANRDLIYAGRPESASTAEGSLRRHAAEQERILAEAVGAPIEQAPERSEVAHAR
jgi:2-oxoglutarate dehydrogenase E1 component